MDTDKEGNLKEVGTSKAWVRKKDENLIKRRRGGGKEDEKALGKVRRSISKIRKRGKRKSFS